MKTKTNTVKKIISNISKLHPYINNMSCTIDLTKSVKDTENYYIEYLDNDTDTNTTYELPLTDIVDPTNKNLNNLLTRVREAALDYFSCHYGSVMIDTVYETTIDTAEVIVDINLLNETISFNLVVKYNDINDELSF